MILQTAKHECQAGTCFPINDSDTLSSPMYVSDEEFTGAMIQFFDCWANDSKPADNTDIIKLVADLLLGVPSLCLREENCHQRYMAFSPGGDVFSCAEFDVPESVIGNFLTQTPEEFAASDARELLVLKAPVPENAISVNLNLHVMEVVFERGLCLVIRIDAKAI